MGSYSSRKCHGSGILGLLTTAFFVLAAVFIPRQAQADDYHIGMIGPITGKSPANGRHHRQGIMLLLDKINLEGGINGKKVVLDIFDDKNDKVLCRKKALEAATQSQVLAVIGHNYSSCSISASPVYKEQELLAISPSSTDAVVTANNDWFFRTIFNNSLQGRFLANYANSIFQAKKVAVVYEDLAFGSYLASVFEQTADQLGMNIVEKQEIKTREAGVDEAIVAIVQRIKNRADIDMIFLSTHAPEGIKFIKRFKDEGLRIPVIAPSSLAAASFSNGFKDFPKERMIPGYYNNGVFVSSPIIFDNANLKAQRFNEEYMRAYNDKTDWRAAFAYDAALLLVEAIKNTGVTGDADKLEVERKAIRDYIAGLDAIERSVDGVTGFNYFNRNGDPQKPISIGVFQNRNVISSLTQLRTVRSLGEIANLEKALESKRVLLIEGRYMYQTKVVYSGIEFNEITDVDMDDLTCTLDFNLWFRYQGDVDISDITFINALEQIELGKPIKEYQYDRINYKLYRVKGKFTADTIGSVRPYGRHSLGVSFAHNDLTKNNLIFVKDVIGLGGKQAEAILSDQEKTKILRPIYGWSIQNMSFFQSTAFENIKGDPKYLNARNGLLEFSQFNVEVLIKENKATIRGIVPGDIGGYVALFSFILLVVVIGSGRYSLFKPYRKTRLLFKYTFWLLLLLSFEAFLVAVLSGVIDVYQIGLVTLVFDNLWWVVPAILIIQSVEALIWKPLERKSGQIIPGVIRGSVAFVILLLTCFGIIAYVYDQKLTSLLATSGVFAMVIGLAIQMNISNIFSGIAINLERPYRVGDWVTIGSSKEGRVINMTWRATHLSDRIGCVIVIPNAKAAESIIHNFSLPGEMFYWWNVVNIDPSHSPERVKKVLFDAVMAVNERILKDPSPWVVYANVEEWSAVYWVCWATENAQTKFLARQEVWFSIWKHLKNAGIGIAIKKQELHMFQGVKPIAWKEASAPLAVLNGIDLFKELPDEAKVSISERMIPREFEANETIVDQDSTDDSMFILVEGAAGLWVRTDDDQAVETSRLGSGHLFGEMTLMTGEPRSASLVAVTPVVLFEVRKSHIADIVKADPETATLFRDELVKLNLAGGAMESDAIVSGAEKERMSELILQKIQQYYSV
ncbi:MAG: ABC transporter substrate-binding protein [Proteobacteria bacterium]|nr:ABC transporter substrate-binding protein [Pseudomonadota bacterium]